MRVYISCFLHLAKANLRRLAKRIIRGDRLPTKSIFVDFSNDDFDDSNYLKYISDKAEAGYINEIEVSKSISKDMVYPVENLITNLTLRQRFKESYRNKVKTKCLYCSDVEEAVPLWEEFITNSMIPIGYKNGGLSYAGFIKEYQEWCLPSWTWTSSALVRYYCMIGHLERALEIGEILLRYQTDLGGWIVRNDYGPKDIKPLIAPNDSAYIANNACLSVFKAAGKREYIEAAIRCADWIIDTARSDGMVYFGFDTFKNEWETDHNIVDVGFTAGLYSELYGITKELKYLEFAKKFTDAYISLFYNEGKKQFCSSIGKDDKPRGTGFARGQAWALEGIIPFYEISGDKRIEEIIMETIETLLIAQNSDGSWPRNLDKPQLGSDCKGTPVIAYSLFKWTRIYNNDENFNKRIIEAVQKSLKWCAIHTVKNGTGRGGIFSFCYEGAVVHHPYTSTAFVYGSSYALEIAKMLGMKW